VSGSGAKLAGIASPALAVVAAGVLGACLVLVVGESPLRVARTMVVGLATPDGIGAILFGTTTLGLTGLSVAFAFRAGLFNIGAEGQLLVGAFVAAITALSLDRLPAILLVPACVLAAAAGGALWAAIPGLLRARVGAHEVINTIMMNFVASGLTSYLTVHVFQEAGQGIPQTAPIPDAARVPRLGEILPGIPAASPANATALVALIATGLAAWILHRTPLGFEIRAFGLGERAARTAGLPTGATIVAAMAIAGAFAGLAGVNDVLGFRHRFLDGFSGGVGFVGIAVALLGRARMGGVLAAALLFGILSAGALEVDLFTEVPRELVLVVQAAILLFVVAADEVGRRLLARLRAGSVP
jgi:simple sugar transport system permease protein